MQLLAPSSIGNFCFAVGTGDLSNANFVIRNLTPFNYMVAYNTTNEQRALFDKMLSKPMWGGAASVAKGNLAPPVNGIRYCASCLREDLNKRPIGELYWRLSHQLPSVLVCIKHRIPLQIDKWLSTERRSKFNVPTESLINPSKFVTASKTIDENAMSILSELAVKSQSLIDGRMEYKSPDVALEGHLAHIRQLGLTRETQPDLAKIAISFKDIMGPVVQFLPFIFSPDGHPGLWLKRFLNGGHHNKQPLPNLLVELWLSRASPHQEHDSRQLAFRTTKVETTAQKKERERIATLRLNVIDANLAQQVSDAAEKIKSRVPLVQVTRSKLAAELEKSALSRVKTAKTSWPLTSEAITFYQETVDAFFRRRLEVEIEKVVAEGKKLHMSLILTRLGLRTKHDIVVEHIEAWKNRPGGDK